LNYDLLYLAAGHANLSRPAAEEVNTLFHPRTDKLVPLHTMLGLNRDAILADAKLRLPIWQAVPILRLFWRLFRGRKKKSGRTASQGESSAVKVYGAEHTTRTKPAGEAAEAQGPANSREDAVAYRRKIQALQKEYVGEGGNVDMTLAELAEKWNPLLDPTAKNNLVEDVNSLVRDFLRRLRGGFRKVPPSRERVQELARQLSQNDSFDKIKRREYLQRYLELYMLKLLGKK
jgi:hypothetical protein